MVRETDTFTTRRSDAPILQHDTRRDRREATLGRDVDENVIDALTRRISEPASAIDRIGRIPGESLAVLASAVGRNEGILVPGSENSPIVSGITRRRY